MPSLLFVCVHNACRSQIAEAICKNLAPKDWKIESAGSNPSSQVDPKAIKILKRHRLTMTSIKPKGFSDLSVEKWDYVVGMGCGDVCPYVPAKKYIEWDIPDPNDGPMELYQTLYNDLTGRIHQLIREIQGFSP
ncbi:MAG: low molecular weight phosphatase family protein [Elusimicrobia bacterium]|nr:low molecular weight phosphatase family protein [Elusimicrobiota bacterium]